MKMMQKNLPQFQRTNYSTLVLPPSCFSYKCSVVVVEELKGKSWIMAIEDYYSKTSTLNFDPGTAGLCNTKAT